jgi:hypothetical protein
MECGACQNWIKPLVDREARTTRCPECGHVERFETFPLFILTGTSGTGKSAVLPELRRLLAGWEIFETDILWDSAGDWSFVHCNWLRIAHSIALSGRPTLLCGTILPEHLEDCDSRHLFRRIYYLALDCDDETRDARLRARPAWRGVTEEKLSAYRACARWLAEHAADAFDPPLVILDTTDTPVAQTARQIHDWATYHWTREQRSSDAA